MTRWRRNALTVAAAVYAAGPIYPETARAEADVKTALAEAAKSNKRVLVDFGGNWCGDCKVLDMHLAKPRTRNSSRRGYVVVHVNVGDKGIDSNFALAERYGIPLKKACRRSRC
jgi:thiol:disulfide interchange protein